MDTSPLTARPRPSLDSVGATASFACAVHCAVVALMLGVMPAASFLAAPWIDGAFLAASTIIGVTSLVPGFRVHRRPAPLSLFAAGLGMLIALRLLDVGPSRTEVLVVVVAASALIAAHWQNRGLLHRCGASAGQPD